MTARRAPVVTAQRLTKVFGAGENAVQALRGIDVSFESGAFTAIMGPSGSGKSTLMHCLAGLESATCGRVEVGGAEITGMGDRELTMLRRERVGFVFQSFNLLPMLTAEQNILLPLEIAGKKPDRAFFDELAGVTGLQKRLGHLPSELSGGQQQRVAIARAFVARPDVVFADEPTGNLDSVSGTGVLDFLRTSVRRFGQTVVMVTHDARAASYADRAVFLRDGALVDDMHEPATDAVLQTMVKLEV